jgi:hypothetical protein
VAAVVVLDSSWLVKRTRRHGRTRPQTPRRISYRAPQHHRREERNLMAEQTDQLGRPSGATPSTPSGAASATRPRRTATVSATAATISAPLSLGMGILAASYGTTPDLWVALPNAVLAALLVAVSGCGFAVVAGRRPARTASVLAWLAAAVTVVGCVAGTVSAAGGAGSPLLSVASPGFVGLLATVLAASVRTTARALPAARS